MSFNKHVRDRWCEMTLRQAVKRFHQERVKEENEAVPLAELAIRSAWYVFHQRERTILGDRMLFRKRYADMAFEKFTDECRKVITEQQEAEELVA